MRLCQQPLSIQPVGPRLGTEMHCMLTFDASITSQHIGKNHILIRLDDEDSLNLSMRGVALNPGCAQSNGAIPSPSITTGASVST